MARTRRHARGERHRPRAPGLIAALAAAVACIACTAKSEAPAGLGRPVATGPVRAFSAAPDGAWFALLDGCRDARASVLPPGTASCDLRVVPAAGGEARRVAEAVTTLPQGVVWSRDGALAALAGYDYPSASGTLVLWRGGQARTLAAGVTFHGFGPNGALGWISGGKLAFLLPGEAAPREVRGAEQVATFELSPRFGDPAPAGCKAGDAPLVQVAARHAHAAGGGLLVVGCDLAAARELEKGQVGDYGFAPGSAALAYTVQERAGAELKVVATSSGVAGWSLGTGARGFAFSPSGKSIAFVSDARPGKQGDLQLSAEPRRTTRLAKDVGEFTWARAAERLAWLERYDPRVRSGTLGVGGPGLAPRALAENVSEFELSPDGAHVAFLQHTTRGGYSVDLAVAHLDAARGAAPQVVARGVFGFAFSPDGRWIYYRTRCIRNAEACDLERVPAAGLAAGATAEAVAPGVKSFEFDPRDPERLLLTWQRMDMVALDVGLWERGRVTTIDRYAAPGSARFLGPDSRRVGYVVIHPKRQGLYVAELPKP